MGILGIAIVKHYVHAAVITLLLCSACSTRSNNHPYDSADFPDVITAALFDSLSSLYPDTEVSSGKIVFETDIPRNAAGSVILMVSMPDENEDFVISLTGDNIGDVQFSQLHAIPVLQNTGYFGMTEKQIGFDNRNIIRHAPFSVYEVLVPSSPGRFSGKTTYAFYLKRRIKADTEPGPVLTEISVRNASGDEIEKMTWILNIYPVVLPEGKGTELYYTNWFNGPREGYTERFDADWWRLMEEHIVLMREGGQNVAKVPESIIFNVQDGRQVVNPERLNRFMTLCENNGFLLFEGPPPAGRKSSFLNKGVVLKRTRYETFSIEAADEIAETYRPLYEFLVERDSLDSWRQHVLDEPLSKHSEDYHWLAAEIRNAMPGVGILDATKTRKPLVGAVDVWSPLVSDYQNNRVFFQERQEAGEEVWIYSCMVPGGPWINRTMDQERLRSVYVGWGASIFNVTGYLRWDLDSWRGSQNIWEGELTGSDDSIVRRPFGDGFVVFPGENGSLLSTTRWEAGRLGMEDYRLLQILKESDPEAHEHIVSICFTDFKTYETDPSIYRLARRELLEVLSE